MKRINNFALEIASNIVWTNVYGLARTLLAIGTLITLCFNSTDVLFMEHMTAFKLLNADVSKISLFELLSTTPEVAKGIAIVLLLLVISGWYPQITGILHWWVTFSLTMSCTFIDGGDQIANILTFLLIPVCLTDRRKNHWDDFKPFASESAQQTSSLFANSFFFMCRLQMAVIYFHAGAAKLFVEEWQNGTAVYYWFLNDVHGMSEWLRPLGEPLLTNGVFVTLFTWGVMIYEIWLFTGLVIHKRYRPLMLASGIAFHFGIVLVHGLVSFFFSMAAGLVLFLRPSEQIFYLTIPKKIFVDLPARLFGKKLTA